MRDKMNMKNNKKCYFSSKINPIVVVVVLEVNYQESVLMLYRKMSVLLRIISSDKLFIFLKI